MRKILVTIPAYDKHKEYLESIDQQAEFVYCEQSAVTEVMVAEATIIIGNVNPKYLKQAKNLTFMQLDSAGVEAFIAPGVLPPGVLLANASGAYGLAISEYMVGSVFLLQKKFHLYLENMTTQTWRDEGKVKSIADSVTLALGVGDIGSQFAQKMHALGSRVIGVRRNKTSSPPYLEALYQIDELDDILPKADIVACSLPGTPETKHLLDKNRLLKMKKGAIIVNVGRGSLIPTQDLYDVLQEGHLGGAALDVTEIEPLPKDSPLWRAPNLLLTPHIAGWYHVPQILESMVEIAGDNLKAVLHGGKIRNEVDFEAGYRKFKG